MRFAVVALFAGAVVAAPWYGSDETESTVYLTTTDVITSCGPTVENCPARSTPPLAAVSTTSTASTTPSPEPTVGPIYTTSTAYVVASYTVTSCAASVISCPAESTIVVTSTISSYTTICPVTATETGSPVASPTEIPASESPASSATVAPIETSTLPAAASTVAPVPTVAPVTTEAPAAAPTVAPASSGFPVTPANGTAVVSPTISPFQGAASSFGASVGVAGLLAVAAIVFA